MGKNIKFIASGNSEKNFGIILKDIEKISKEQNIPVQEVIKSFISDLENFYEEEYEKKINQIVIKGQISENLRRSLIEYLGKVIKRYDLRDKKDREKEKVLKRRIEKENKQKEFADRWKSIEDEINASDDFLRLEIINKKITEINDGIDSEELSEEEKKHIVQRLELKIKQENEKNNKKEKKINETWSEITRIVENAAAKSTISSLKIWEQIKKGIGKEIGIEIPETIECEVMSLINGKINEEKDLIYYEQVKYFTKNFSFFREYPEVVMAATGRFSRKFTDFEAHERYCELREKLRKGKDEYQTIRSLLESEKLNEVDRRILSERMCVIEKQRSKNCEVR